MTDHVKKIDRERVMADYNNCCAACGLADPDLIGLDHVQPESHARNSRQGIDNSPRNLQVLCQACNNLKGNIPYMKKLAPRMPEYDTRECVKNRAVWREIVKNAKGETRLWD